MPISVTCACGRKLRARDEFAGTRAECPTCGETIIIPAAPPPLPTESVSKAEAFVAESSAGSSQSASAREGEAAPTAAQSVDSDSSTYRLRQDDPPAASGDADPMEIVDFFDPPKKSAKAAAPTEPAKPVVVRMLEALLDPKAIHWMLTIGGGLAVLGLIIYLVSLRVFDNPLVMAAALGLGSLAVLAGGWWMTLRTRYRVAGQALTFLGCVVAPLNLWFYHAQNLVTLDQHLWVGGLVCVALYVATVFVLRDPLFMYAVEAGVTLTVLLLMADLGMVSDVGRLALFLVGLAVISIHAERAFAPDGEFSRKRYGLPLFWSGHAQLGVALVMLLSSQIAGWLIEPLKLTWGGNLLTQNNLLAGGLWIAATYLYFYSDLVVRRIGVYISLAAVSLMMAMVTLVLQHLNQEGLITVLALTSLVTQIVQTLVIRDNEKISRYGKQISALMAQIPVLMGVILHLRATSSVADATGWRYETGWPFVGAMAVVMVCNRVSAWLCRRSDSKLSATYFFFSAAAAIVGAAGILRQVGWTEWSYQAIVLMLIPIAYMVASRLWRGHTPEEPLARVAHTATAVILVGTLMAALRNDPTALVRPVTADPINLRLGLVFIEATLFYVLAGWFRKRSWNASYATIAACGALWQLLGYFGVPSAAHTLIYAGLGLASLAAARMMGLETVERYSSRGEKSAALRGQGLTMFRAGNGVLSVALVIALLKGLGELTASSIVWFDLTMLILTTGAGAAGIFLVPPGGWRRWYTVATIGLAAVTFLTLNVLINLSGWQKLEIFCVVIGLVLLAVGHVGRFRESHSTSGADDTVSLGLWFGSLLAAVPLFVAMFYHRFIEGTPSRVDELALLTVTILMLVSGCSWQIKSTTLLGGLHLGAYLVLLIGSLAYRPEVAVGVYLLAGGGLVFAVGVVLSIYRDRLLAIPEQITKREGLFRVIDWR